SAGKSSNETIATQRKETTNIPAKRAKLSVGTSLTNQPSPAADTKLPQTDTVDMHGQFIKGKVTDYELYSNRATKQLGIENDLQYGNLHKDGTVKTVAMTENLDMYVEGVSSKKSFRGNNNKIESEEGIRRSSPIIALPAGIESSGARVKIEREYNNDGMGNTRISPDLTAVLKRAAGIDDTEMGSVENSSVQAQQSPSSEDSGGGNFGPDATATAVANRIHLSPGLSLTGYMSAPPSRQSVLCPICGRLISQRRNLNQHMRIHQMVTMDDGSNQAESPQMSVDNVQARCRMNSRIPRARLQQMEDLNNAEVITEDPVVLPIEPKIEPHYS
ncbi:hypothetical protein L9F63_005541, partial [Diploptera punctata]